MTINSFEIAKKFEYENAFYATSTTDRFAKLLAHYELYKRIVDLPGNVVECGVFKGNSIFRFAYFREVLENVHSRKIIGFDIFGKFPETSYQDDKKLLDKFISDTAGGESISLEEMNKAIEYKKISHTEFIKGDILETVPDYAKSHPEMKISLLHIDTDVYEPAVCILENFYDCVVKGGLIVFDDYGTFPGETKAADDFIRSKQLSICKLPYYHIPSFIIKD
ncbi:MAG: class I SAM-dependent methyltransferase [Bacteroidetes bacterium]|nr:class I SAM-dependent methyltransferase [Bacteroidota bacterium]